MKTSLAILLMIPALSFAASSERTTFLGADTDPTVQDVRLVCGRTAPYNAEMSIEILSKFSDNRKELYRATKKGIGEIGTNQEITISRNGVDVCRYLVEAKRTFYGDKPYFVVRSKIALQKEQFCEGEVGKKLTINLDSHELIRKSYMSFGTFVNICNGQSKEVQEYLSRPIGQAGKVPKTISSFDKFILDLQ